MIKFRVIDCECDDSRALELVHETQNSLGKGVHPPMKLMHIAYSPYFHKIYKCPPPISVKFMNSPYFRKMYVFCLTYVFSSSSILTMMHLCQRFRVKPSLD